VELLHSLFSISGDRIPLVRVWEAPGRAVHASIPPLLPRSRSLSSGTVAACNEQSAFSHGIGANAGARQGSVSGHGSSVSPKNLRCLRVLP